MVEVGLGLSAGQVVVWVHNAEPHDKATPRHARPSRRTNDWVVAADYGLLHYTTRRGGARAETACAAFYHHTHASHPDACWWITPCSNSLRWVYRAEGRWVKRAATVGGESTWLWAQRPAFVAAPLRPLRKPCPESARLRLLWLSQPLS
jgi:hypothetical protein